MNKNVSKNLEKEEKIDEFNWRFSNNDKNEITNITPNNNQKSTSELSTYNLSKLTSKSSIPQLTALGLENLETKFMYGLFQKNQCETESKTTEKADDPKQKPKQNLIMTPFFGSKKEEKANDINNSISPLNKEANNEANTSFEEKEATFSDKTTLKSVLDAASNLNKFYKELMILGNLINLNNNCLISTLSNVKNINSKINNNNNTNDKEKKLDFENKDKSRTQKEMQSQIVNQDQLSDNNNVKEPGMKRNFDYLSQKRTQDKNLKEGLVRFEELMNNIYHYKNYYPQSIPMNYINDSKNDSNFNNKSIFGGKSINFPLGVSINSDAPIVIDKPFFQDPNNTIIINSLKFSVNQKFQNNQLNNKQNNNSLFNDSQIIDFSNYSPLEENSKLIINQTRKGSFEIKCPFCFKELTNYKKYKTSTNDNSVISLILIYSQDKIGNIKLLLSRISNVFEFNRLELCFFILIMEKLNLIDTKNQTNYNSNNANIESKLEPKPTEATDQIETPIFSTFKVDSKQENSREVQDKNKDKENIFDELKNDIEKGMVKGIKNNGQVQEKLEISIDTNYLILLTALYVKATMNSNTQKFEKKVFERFFSKNLTKFEFFKRKWIDLLQSKAKNIKIPTQKIMFLDEDNINNKQYTSNNSETDNPLQSICLILKDMVSFDELNTLNSMSCQLNKNCSQHADYNYIVDTIEKYNNQDYYKHIGSLSLKEKPLVSNTAGRNPNIFNCYRVNNDLNSKIKNYSNNNDSTTTNNNYITISRKQAKNLLSFKKK